MSTQSSKLFVTLHIDNQMGCFECSPHDKNSVCLII